MKGLDWSDERFVRNYTRDTLSWRALPWQARACYYEAKRKADRAGLIQVEDAGLDGLAVLLMLPAEVIQVGVPALAARGYVEWNAATGDLLLVEHIEAEEAPQSDAARQRKSRESRRDKVRRRDVTPDAASEPAYHDSSTGRDQHVAPRDSENDSQSVVSQVDGPTAKKSLLPSVPSSLPPVRESDARERDPRTPEPAPAPPPDFEQAKRSRFQAAQRIYAKQEQERRRIDPKCRTAPPMATTDKIQALLLDRSEDDLLHALAVAVEEAEARKAKGDHDPLQYLNGVTNWLPDVVGRAMQRKLIADRVSAATASQAVDRLREVKNERDRRSAEDRLAKARQAVAEDPPGTMRRQIAEAILAGDDALAGRLTEQALAQIGRPA